MSRLDELKNRLAALTTWRAETVARLQFEIQDVNRTYDQEAIRISREITKLEPVLGATPEPEPAPKVSKPRKTKPKIDVFADINNYNREHGLPEVTE